MKTDVKRSYNYGLSENFNGFTAIVLITFWSYTVIYKWRLYDLFVREITGVPWFGQFAKFLSVFFLGVELLIILLLMFERTRKAGLFGSALLLAVFTGYIMYIFIALPYPPCACAGVIPEGNWNQNLLLSGILLLWNVIALIVILRTGNSGKILENNMLQHEGKPKTSDRVGVI